MQTVNTSVHTANGENVVLRLQDDIGSVEHEFVKNGAVLVLHESYRDVLAVEEDVHIVVYRHHYPEVEGTWRQIESFS